jgi:tRNA(Ile2)-agmatinylcytidine synthase
MEDKEVTECKINSNDDSNRELILYIGLDDTDSREGGCTTYLAYRLVDFLLSEGVDILDYPLLVRLNPNIPWKTRGNGAVCIKVAVDDDWQEMKDGILSIFKDNSHIEYGADPALVFYAGSANEDIIHFAEEALYDVLSKESALSIINKHGLEYYAYGSTQGIVGALASIGTSMYIDGTDYTYEIITYRLREKYGKPRMIDESSVIAMDRSTEPYTFNNYDYKHKRVLIAPHGPDPVLCGIRGEYPELLIKALRMLDMGEGMEGYMIFKSNQGTDAHLQHAIDVNDPKVYTSGYIVGRVVDHPKVIRKGHTFFEVEPFGSSNSIVCAVYEPTGLCHIAQRLCIDDILEVGGGIRDGKGVHQKVLNVEYIRVLEVAEKYIYMNPLCSCGKRLKSEGKNKGYSCKHCGYSIRDASKVRVRVHRDIKEGLYLTDVKAHRHLTKPLRRYMLDKYRFRSRLDIEWFYSNSNSNNNNNNSSKALSIDIRDRIKYS